MSNPSLGRDVGNPSSCSGPARALESSTDCSCLADVDTCVATPGCLWNVSLCAGEGGDVDRGEHEGAYSELVHDIGGDALPDEIDVNGDVGRPPPLPHRGRRAWWRFLGLRGVDPWGCSAARPERNHRGCSHCEFLDPNYRRDRWPCSLRFLSSCPASPIFTRLPGSPSVGPRRQRRNA